MNERIKELWEQSTGAAVPEEGFYSSASKYNIEKFAELIVQECMEVCRRGKYDGRDDMSLIQFNNGIRFCMNAIDEHFGVEE